MPIRMANIQNIENFKWGQGCGINWNPHTMNELENGSQRYYGEWKNHSKCCILYESIYILFLKWQNHSNGEHISGCQGLCFGGVCVSQ